MNSTLLGIRRKRTQKRILSEKKAVFFGLLVLVTFSGIIEPLISSSPFKTKESSINGMDSKVNKRTSSPSILPSELDHSQQLVQQEEKVDPHFGEIIETLRVKETLRTLIFSPSGRYLAYGEHTVRIWDMINWSQLWVNYAFVESLAFSPDETLLACGGVGIRLRSIATGEVVKTLTGSKPFRFEHIVFSIDGKEIIASSTRGFIHVWDVTTGETISQFEQPGREGALDYHTARDIALSPDGSRLAFGAPNGSVFLWDMTNNSITKCQEHTRLARCVAFSPDGTLLVSGSYDGYIRVWNLTSKNELISPLSTSGRVISVSFSPDGTILASGLWRGEDVITLWDVKTWDIISLIPSSNCAFVAYSPTGTVLASIAVDGEDVVLWNVAIGQSTVVSEWKLQESYVNSLALGANGTLAASSRGKNLIKLWKWNASSDEYQLKHNLSGHTDTVISTSIAFSPDDQWLISGSGDKIIRFWNVTNGENQYNLTGHESGVVSVTFSPDNHWLASGDGNGIIKLWNVTDKTNMTLHANLTGHYSAVTNLLFSLDSRLLASSDSLFPNILLWNTPDGTMNSTLIGHTDRITSLAFSPDGTRFASGSWDNIVRIQHIQDDPSSDLELTVSARSTSLAFFSNGLILVTGSLDGSIQFWNTTDGTLLLGWIKPTHEILALTFTVNNSHLISGEGDSTILFWKVDPLPLDSDLDGMLDIWEQRFSLSPMDFFDSFSDSDSDGLMNVMEFLCDTNPTTNDSDSDKLPDLWEFIYQTNQSKDDYRSDIDEDGLENDFEYTFGLNSLINDTLMDFDGDGLTNWVEKEFGSYPNQYDSDLDGMPDLYEYQNDGLNPTKNDSYSDLDYDQMSNLWEYQMGLDASDPSDAGEDLDSDGMPNLWEFQMGLNATDVHDAEEDLDSDGMPNLWEFQMGLDASDASDAGEDIDSDGMPNLWEFQMGLDATDAHDAEEDIDSDGIPNLWEFQMGLDASDANDAALDKDNDTMPNLWEYQMGLNATRKSDADLDTDLDGIINKLEFKYGFNATDPFDAQLDSDSDGISNKAECLAGTDPHNFWSVPLLSISVFHLIVAFFVLIVVLTGVIFVIYKNQQQTRLTASFKAPDYKTALRVRHAGLSDYQALLDAEVKIKGVMEEAITLFYQGEFTKAIQKFDQALDSLESLDSTRLAAENIFYLAQIYKVQGTLTDDSPIFNRFPKLPHDDLIVTTLASMLQALLAETNNNWGEAEKAWKDALLMEDLDTNLQMICQGALAESAFRTWFYDQTYQNQAQVISRLNEWQKKTAEVDSLKGSLCPVYLLHARLALASYRFTEVEQWLERCYLIAEEAGLNFYRDLASREIDRLVQHKERIELLFEADKLLSPEDRGKLLQQYIKKAVLSMESVLDSDVGETM